MDKIRIGQLKTVFDQIAHHINSDDDTEQVEVWFARELQNILGYARWENFIVAIQRAVDSCKTQSVSVDDRNRQRRQTRSKRLHAHSLRLLSDSAKRRPEERGNRICSKLFRHSNTKGGTYRRTPEPLVAFGNKRKIAFVRKTTLSKYL